jgi:isopenicillin-N N-acyltransferase-like protein
MANIEQFPFISVSGSPHERGLQYGRQAASRVRGSARLYGQTLVNLGYGDQARTRLIDFFAKESATSRPTTSTRCAASPKGRAWTSRTS